jgi:GNAT superfamily N-acetyltransferase
MPHQELDWDSVFFGFKVALITNQTLSNDDLAKLLKQLKKQNIRLAYWPTQQTLSPSELIDSRGLLVDVKCTFKTKLRPNSNISTSIQEQNEAYVIEPYSTKVSSEALEELAILSGQYSRFATDPNIEHHKFIELYKQWIHKSMQKEIADEVLIVREGKHLAGMITLGEKNGYGDIGLLAISQRYQGKKYGVKLVKAAKIWCIEHGFEYGQVITQQQNIAATKLYQKCGYHLEKSENYYHFWL